MKRRHEKVTYNYECSLTQEPYVTTEKALHPKELLSIKAYYEMNPEMDDRPAIVKKKLGLDLPPAPAAPSSEEKH